MRFYYFSIFSFMAYAVVVVIGIALLWLLWTKVLKLKTNSSVYWVLAAAIIGAPWMEELWIAYNFDRLCRKDAGLFVNKTVEVAGFCDDTTGWGPRQLEAFKYEFMESRDVLRSRLIRVQRADDMSRDKAVAWHSGNSAKKKGAADAFIVHRLSEKEEIAVSPNGLDAWRTTTIVEPTARYHYKRINDHTPVSHRIRRFENVVIDSQTGDVLGRYTDYYRGPYSFFISSDASTIPCKEAQIAIRHHGTLSIYALTLKPSSREHNR